MKTEQLSVTPGKAIGAFASSPTTVPGAQLVLVFGDGVVLDDVLHRAVSARYPRARVMYCSSGGEFSNVELFDGRSAVITAVEFAGARVDAAAARVPRVDDSASVGRSLALKLPAKGLRHVLVFAEGININGSALTAGLGEGLPAGVCVTGGLAGDGDRFIQTVVGLDGVPVENNVVAIGLYGDRLVVGMGSLGGWEMTGSEMKITRSDGNVLYELNGRPALDIYKRFLGARAYALPASGLMYPLNVRENPDEPGVVRTLLGVDETAKSVTFAGDVPLGRYARFMMADLDKLVSAASSAAALTRESIARQPVELALLVSCIGRKLLLQKRAVEELEQARMIFGSSATITGFYSYGEISPLTPSTKCELHNQTMTITTMSEALD